MTEKAGCRSSALFSSSRMGQRGGWTPWGALRAPSTKIALLFCLYLAGVEHHIILSARRVKPVAPLLLHCKMCSSTGMQTSQDTAALAKTRVGISAAGTAARQNEGIFFNRVPGEASTQDKHCWEGSGSASTGSCTVSNACIPQQHGQLTATSSLPTLHCAVLASQAPGHAAGIAGSVWGCWRWTLR